MSKKLKPCPFCGGKPSIAPLIEQVEHDSWAASINCNSCDVSLTPQYTSTSEDEAVSAAIEQWNRRELESASQPGGGWQPIETAQKDRVVQLWVPGFGTWVDGPWRGAWSYVADQWTLQSPFTAADRRAITVSEVPLPTHWMPLQDEPRGATDATMKLNGEQKV
ncbi:Lar family restriction alleviation protein [Cupriavidus pauculus]|uniref:Restriction alleviation protein, Lar family n=1 Tax=Cupriavidus pauculus TaxID=82633 RepID=A0A2N5C3Z8_9BURK|nr:Lar family restriction alleviation protein [Cupriavidus pauculus]PLP96951.1 hypothetical protein CYJ10_29350 [Cupriavidus pauculus]